MARKVLHFTGLFFLLQFGTINTATAQANNSLSCTVPFYSIRKLIVVKAAVNGQEGNFIVDTGIPAFLLNSKYFEVADNSTIKIEGINGSVLKATKTWVNLQIGTIALSRKLAFSADLSSLEPVMHIPVMGLIGAAFFDDIEVVIDHQNKELSLFQLNNKGEALSPAQGAPPTDVIDFTMKGHLPCFQARVGENTLFLGFDTGAGVNVFNYSMRKKLKGYYTPYKDIKMTGAGQSVAHGQSVQLNSLQIASTPVNRQMVTLFSSMSALNEKLHGPQLDGMIGYELFQQYRIALNFQKKKLYIWQSLEASNTRRP